MSGWVHKTSWLSCHPTATGKWGPAFFEIGCETLLSHSLTSKEYCLKIVHPELLPILGWQRRLPVVATPLPQRLRGTPEPLPGCSAFDDPKPPPCACPVMGAAEARACAVPMRPGLAGFGLPEHDQRRL